MGFSFSFFFGGGGVISKYQNATLFAIWSITNEVWYDENHLKIKKNNSSIMLCSKCQRSINFYFFFHAFTFNVQSFILKAKWQRSPTKQRKNR